MYTISAVIITYNEQKKIAACIESLQGVVDEIVVMDSFSTDNTASICKQLNVKFYQQAWAGYGQQKNDAALKATNDYILSIDADECLSPELKKSILEIKEQGLTGVYKFHRLNNFYGCDIFHGIIYPDITGRLYNKNEIQWSLRPVHEALEIAPGIKTTILNGKLLHKSKDNIHDHIAAINKYSTLTAEIYLQKNKKGAAFKMFFSPIFTFIKGYFFKLGFLDGYAGFIIAKVYAQEAFLKYSKLLILQKANKRSLSK